MLFNDWEGALRTTLAMRGLVSYLVSIERVTVHVVLVHEELTQIVTVVPGQAFQELLCWQKLYLRYCYQSILLYRHLPFNHQYELNLGTHFRFWMRFISNRLCYHRSLLYPQLGLFQHPMKLLSPYLSNHTTNSIGVRMTKLHSEYYILLFACICLHQLQFCAQVFETLILSEKVIHILIQHFLEVKDAFPKGYAKIQWRNSQKSHED